MNTKGTTEPSAGHQLTIPQGAVRATAMVQTTGGVLADEVCARNCREGEAFDAVLAVVMGGAAVPSLPAVTPQLVSGLPS